jgi:4-amino-4-deoxy-L-arabinose transferase-like glycosyltransferase
LIALVADLLLLWPILTIARWAVGDEAAWGAAFLWAVHLSAIRFGVHALSDAPTALCVAAALSVGIRAIEGCRLTYALGAGMLSGLAFLFRPEGLEPALALAVFYGFSRNRHDYGRTPSSGTMVSSQQSAVSGQTPGDTGGAVLGAQRPAVGGSAIRRLGWILAPLVGWALVAGPYVAYISVEAGTLTLSKKKSAASIVRSTVPLVAPGSQDPDTAGRGKDETTLSLSAHWARRWSHSLYLFQKPLVNGLTVVVLVPMCVGLVGILTRRKGRWNRAHGLLAALFLFHFGILAGLAADAGVTYLGRHHFLLMVVYALPVAGGGLVWALEWMSDRSCGRRWAPATVLSVIVVATGLAVVTRGPDQGQSLRSAARWIQSQVVGTPVIVTSLAKLTYHANAKRVAIAGTYDEILQRARDRSAHFVALYPDLISQTSPDFLARVCATDMELVKVFPEPSPTAPDQRLEIYRLRPRKSDATS